MTKLVLVALLAVVQVASAYAQSGDHSPSKRRSRVAASDCSNPITLADLAVCGERERASSEQRLDAAYAKVLAGLHKADAEFARMYPDRQKLGAAAAFESAQAAWEGYRDQACALEGLILRSGNPSRGDYEAIETMACGARLADARAKELEELAKTYQLPE